MSDNTCSVHLSYAPSFDVLVQTTLENLLDDIDRIQHKIANVTSNAPLTRVALQIHMYPNSPKEQTQYLLVNSINTKIDTLTLNAQLKYLIKHT